MNESMDRLRNTFSALEFVLAVPGYKKSVCGTFFFQGKKKVKALELHESERERGSKRGTALWLVIS